jgi:hypothetical protein
VEFRPNSVYWGVIDDARRRQHAHRRVAAAAAAGIVVLTAWATLGLDGGSAPRESAIPSGLSARIPGPTLTASSLTSCLVHERNGVQGTPSKALLDILGVLRRPATPADALPRRALDGSAAYLRYVRRARVVGGVSYYVYPVVAVGCGQSGAYDAIALLSTRAAAGHGVALGAGWDGATAADIEKGGAFGGGTPLFNNGPTITMIVPDGVASVTLHYPTHLTRTAQPVNNVLIIQAPRRGISPVPGLMIWRTADGHIIKTFHRL